MRGDIMGSLVNHRVKPLTIGHKCDMIQTTCDLGEKYGKAINQDLEVSDDYKSG
jgi:hypothetical protein